jgi:hypothetical protein
VAPERILCLRHAEEPDGPELGFDGRRLDEDALAVPGWQRAGALAATRLCGLLEPAAPGGVRIFVPSYGGEPEAHRSHQTMAPLAARLGIAIASTIERDDVDGLAAAVLASSGLVVVCWQHKRLERLGRSLTGDAALDWPAGRFDLVWDLRPTGAPGRYACAAVDQRLLAGDRGLA